VAKKIGSETVHVIRKAKVDRLSSATSTSSEHDVEGCVVLPRLASGAQNSSEQGKGWVIVEGKMIIAPFGSDVLADDAVTLVGDSVQWQVDGPPGPYKNKRGRGKATIFYLKRLGT
jgi:hypothetical protein